MTKSEIITICNHYGITNYTINDDGTVDVRASVFLQGQELDELPLTFGNVIGSFYCFDNKLTTLKGAPQFCRDIFNCSNNLLTTLEHCPETTSLGFSCINNPIVYPDGYYPFFEKNHPYGRLLSDVQNPEELKRSWTIKHIIE